MSKNSFSMDIIINSTKEEIFKVLTDIESAPLWYTQVLSNEVLTDGPFGVGTSWKETRKVMFVKATGIAECVEYEQDSHYKLKIDASSYMANVRLSVQELSEGCKVTYDGECFKKDGDNWIPSEKITKLVSKLDSKMLPALKSYIEKN